MKFKVRPALWISLIGLTGFAAQCVFSFALWERLTFEEIAESIRNPYWISGGDIFDGISSNIVYYKALDLYYRVGGFHLFAAKEFRLILSLLSISVVGTFLYRCVPFTIATAVAFLAWVLSPTLLYFGTHQASFGIDLQVFPVVGVIWLCSLRSTGLQSTVLLFLAAFLAILLAGMFPPGLFYLPALILTDVIVRSLKAANPSDLLKGACLRLSIIGGGILAGLAVPFLLVNRPQVLYFDPHTGAGLFRGGGKLSLNPFAFWDSVWRTFLDLFHTGNSYQFYLPHPEFGTILAAGGVLSAVLILLLVIRGFQPPRKSEAIGFLRQPNVQIGLFAGVLLMTFLVMGHLSPNLPGLRRSAGILVALYLFYFLAIDIGFSRSLTRNALFQRVLMVILLALPVSHVIQLTMNLQELPELSHDAYPNWLKTRPSARESLALLYTEVKEGRALTCEEVPAGCRYSAPFAAVQLTHRSQSEAGQVLDVYAEDPKTGTVKLVKRSLWEDYYWIH
ncbi:hypothetical protein G0Q06_07715 [Puniceicoccales bacterium CK1056]|uniref:Glycosyltransferase RgtA/B/C/D-like domain-containing protein n=1 Tax=Oceanipulchritudo coccoides TaxID=2706888 RepID=A0A6B2M050_9BACT|nr:hypothetical protein [Oceanipulchritudo coccoides]NDV62331.1 hypothetical protein [Oceanipulchritudo coccoides]